MGYNEDQARDEGGRWTSSGGRTGDTSDIRAQADKASRGLDKTRRELTKRAVDASEHANSEAGRSLEDQIQAHEDAAYAHSAAMEDLRNDSDPETWDDVKALADLHEEQAAHHVERADKLSQAYAKGGKRKHTREMKGVEIFAEGTWNGLTYGERELDGLASSFDAFGLSGRVPLKLGHDGPDARESPESQFALGWVTKVYRDGKKLLSDWEVPETVHRWIGEGLLRHVSVEMLKDVRAGTRVVPWVLDAVALLGSEPPAVGILKNLKESMSRRATHSSHGGLVSFSRVGVINFNSGEGSKMSDGTKELAEQLAEMRLKLAKADERNDALAATNKELLGIKSKFTALEADVKAREVKAHRAAIVGRLEQLVKSDEIQPRTRETFERVNGVNDDDQVMKLTLEDVDAYAKAYPNPYRKRVNQKVVSLTRADGDVPEGTPADVELTMRAEAQLRGEGKSEWTSEEFQKAVVRLFRANPQLGERYKVQVNAAIDHPSARQ